MIIQEPMEVLIARADKFVINREVLDRLQENFASEILTIALIRSQMLISEREQAAAQAAQAQQSSQSPGNASPTRPALGSSISSHFASLTNLAHGNSSKKGTAEDSVLSNGTVSTDLSADDASSVNTGLASLSLAERRKVMQVSVIVVVVLTYSHTV